MTKKTIKELYGALTLLKNQFYDVKKQLYTMSEGMKRWERIMKI